MTQGWIAVDLDGTLAEYDRWRGIDHVGAPISLMVSRVQRWLIEGKDVRVFTARVSPVFEDRDQAATRKAIEDWCERHIGRVLPITNEKDFGMIELWDDRCVQVESNTGVTLQERLLAEAGTWQGLLSCALDELEAACGVTEESVRIRNRCKEVLDARR